MIHPFGSKQNKLARLRAERDALAEEVADLRRAVEELRVLNEVAAALGAANDLEAVLHELVRRAFTALGAEQGVIVLVKEQDGQVEEAYTLVRTRAAATTHEALRPNEAVLGWMLQNVHPLVLNEPASDVRFRGVAWALSVRSLLAVPMLAAGRLIGVLTLYNKTGEGRFAPEDARLLTILAAQSAMVVERARLAEEGARAEKERAEAEVRRAEAEAERDRVVRAFGQATAPAVVEGIRKEGVEGLRQRFGFTKQEARVALLLAERKTNQEIADALVVSPSTARGHTEQVLEKLGVATRRAVAEALGHGNKSDR